MNVHIPKKIEGSYVDNQREDYSFKFDNVLHNCSQETVYEEVARDIVLNCMQGYNGTILAYGQTGAGKTYTIVISFTLVCLTILDWWNSKLQTARGDSSCN